VVEAVRLRSDHSREGGFADLPRSQQNHGRMNRKCPAYLIQECCWIKHMKPQREISACDTEIS